MPHFTIVLIPYITSLNLFLVENCLFLGNMEPLNLDYQARGSYVGVRNKDMLNITKTCLFKYIENFTSKNIKFSDKKV